MICGTFGYGKLQINMCEDKIGGNPALDNAANAVRCEWRMGQINGNGTMWDKA